MAFCASRLGQHNHFHILTEFSAGFDHLENHSKTLSVEYWQLRGSRSLRYKNHQDLHYNYNWEAILPRSVKSRRKQKLKILGMLIPQDGDSDVTSSSANFILEEESNVSVKKDSCDSKMSSVPQLVHGGGGGDLFGGNGGNGKFSGGGDGGDYENDDEEEEFGPILKFEEVIREVEARGAKLPSNMLEAAKSIGIRKVLLLRYLDLQCSIWPLGVAVRSCSLLRNRMLADPSFLFKVGTEIVIDSCCATFAEIQKRGKDFWAEFELYVADLLVGTVVNVALVGMLAPYARIGGSSMSNGFLGRLKHAYGALPSSVFEAGKFSIQQRIGTYFFKGVLYASVGFVCGVIGQGIANMIMTAKRSIRKSEEDVPVPPLLKSAALWGVFLAVSSNTRYQLVNGLERLVEASPVGKRTPPVAMAFTVGIRFANNVYGGMQFVDWARWSGVQ